MRARILLHLSIAPNASSVWAIRIVMNHSKMRTGSRIWRMLYSIPMLYRKPRIGHDISTYCGRCKDERTHVVAAMDGETVSRVTCSMCGSNHLYRQKATATSRSTKAGGGSKKTKQSTRDIDLSAVKSYSMNARFSAGDFIDHPKFGIGAVETELAPNKIEVKFQEGRKLLLHNMKS